jgi:hypothetical protein
VVLRYLAVHPNGDSVVEQAVVFYSGLQSSTHSLAVWGISVTFGSACLPEDECFAGDYRYGAFYKKVGGTLS